jgi:hypothetical protein
MESCDFHLIGDKPFVVVNPAGQALQPTGDFGSIAITFQTVEEARAARPGHADGTATSRVIFTNQLKRFAMCGCLK